MSYIEDILNLNSYKDQKINNKFQLLDKTISMLKKTNLFRSLLDELTNTENTWNHQSNL